jgi:hypothetical protein
VSSFHWKHTHTHTQVELPLLLLKAMEQWRRCACGHWFTFVAAAVLVVAMLPCCAAKLSPDYYRLTCPDVEAIVRGVVEKKVKETFVTVPATLRLCFIQVSGMDPRPCCCAFEWHLVWSMKFFLAGLQSY